MQFCTSTLCVRGRPGKELCRRSSVAKSSLCIHPRGVWRGRSGTLPKLFRESVAGTPPGYSGNGYTCDTPRILRVYPRYSGYSRGITRGVFRVYPGYRGSVRYPETHAVTGPLGFRSCCKNGDSCDPEAPHCFFGFRFAFRLHWLFRAFSLFRFIWLQFQHPGFAAADS